MQSGLTIQTRCINIYDENEFYLIKTENPVQKIEIFDYS